jgi:hypothetical protein
MWLQNPFHCSYREGKFHGEFILSPSDYALSALMYLMESDQFDEPVFHASYKRKAISHFRDLPYPEGVGFFADKNLKEILSAIKIHKDDFHRWCLNSGYELPRFWFGATPSPQEQEPQSQEISPQELGPISLETMLGEIVRKAFWSTPPPEGHNRPLKDEIVDWLINKYSVKGLTKAAAVRVFRASRPDFIPRQGNVKQTNQPFPTPPYPPD